MEKKDRREKARWRERTCVVAASLPVAGRLRLPSGRFLLSAPSVGSPGARTNAASSASGAGMLSCLCGCERACSAAEWSSELSRRSSPPASPSRRELISCGGSAVARRERAWGGVEDGGGSAGRRREQRESKSESSGRAAPTAAAGAGSPQTIGAAASV
eukprot:scaffold194224_cov28-Tisochrysis_lutea.AAC.1